jgi:transcriptional regulator with XRE-family HTH domain
MSALSEPDRILDFGAMLRDWRSYRGVSQLALSMRSGISQRHISCLETGRARPSRPMVLALADALAVPLRERNALLARSGFAPAYGAAPLDAEALRMFREAVDLALAHHEPYPALVLDGRWNLVKLNGAALALFGRCVDPVAALAAIGSPASYQVVRLCLDDRGLRPFIVNWQELVYSFLLRARQGLLHNPGDAELKGLIDEILAHPDAPRRWHAPDWTTPPRRRSTWCSTTARRAGRCSPCSPTSAHRSTSPSRSCRWSCSIRRTRRPRPGCSTRRRDDRGASLAEGLAKMPASCARPGH